MHSCSTFLLKHPPEAIRSEIHPRFPLARPASINMYTCSFGRYVYGDSPTNSIPCPKKKGLSRHSAFSEAHGKGAQGTGFILEGAYQALMDDKSTTPGTTFPNS